MCVSARRQGYSTQGTPCLNDSLFIRLSKLRWLRKSGRLRKQGQLGKPRGLGESVSLRGVRDPGSSEEPSLRGQGVGLCCREQQVHVCTDQAGTWNYIGCKEQHINPIVTWTKGAVTVG